MHSLNVLVCSRDQVWRNGVAAALGETCHVVQKDGDPQYADLSMDEPAHPPDIVVWHLDLSDPSGRSLYRGIREWAPGTKFILQAADLSPAETQACSLEPEPAALLDPSSPLSEVVRTVNRVAPQCWWTELSQLEVPACEVSPGGRILRANPSMLREFGPLGDSPYFRLVIEGTSMGDLGLPGFAAAHPIQRAIDTRSARCDFVETKHGEVQLVCVPRLMGDGSISSISVLMPDTGRRARVLDFAHAPKAQDLEGIHAYVVECAFKLGFKRVRLYRFDSERGLFLGAEAKGFRDPKKYRYFKTRFRMPVRLDLPSRDILRDRLPAVCIHDPRKEHVDKASRLVRVYTEPRPRAYSRLLEHEGANRWIEAPLVVPGTDEVIGRIDADNGAQSDELCVRDALDLGCLAMMAAGAIYAFQETEQKSALTRHSAILKEVHELLPTIAFERNEKAFYRMIAAILSCDPGLGWEQVMLFVADSAGLKQAKCVMALGGHSESMREYLRLTRWNLRDYVNHAQNHREPKGDYLYDSWVALGDKEECQVVRFGEGAAAGGPLAELLAGPTDERWREIVVSENDWCRRVIEAIPDTFNGKRIFAFPLTKSFALDMEVHATLAATQPVGIVVVGMVTEGREVEAHRLVFTRVVLDLLGPLIAQRWTNQRMEGMFGALFSFYHCPLSKSWEDFKAAADEWSRDPEDVDLRLEYEERVKEHDKYVEQIQFAQSTIENLGGVGKRDLDVARYFDEHVVKWKEEWDGTHGTSELQVKLMVGPDDLLVECHPVVFHDAMTCLVRNAAEAAKRRNHRDVTVEVSVGEFAGSGDFLEILVTDDAGGVDPEAIPFLFVKGVSHPPGGSGRGLALARAGLLMYSGDLHYVPDARVGGATFRVVLRRRCPRVRL